MVLSFAPQTAFADTIIADGKCGDNLTWTLDDAGTLNISGTGAMDVMSEWNGRGDDIKSVVIGDGVTSIGDGAFKHCINLASVTIPDSVTSIGNNAFDGCRNLESVTIPDSVTSIGDNAFDDCRNLASVTIPDSVTSIGANVFQGTLWAKSHGDFLVVNSMLLQYQGVGGDVTVPSSVERIVEYVFYCNYSITSLTIPDSVTSIGDYAFYNCSNLETVNYTGDQSEWEKISIGNGNDVLNKMQFAVVGRGPCGDNITWTLDTNGTLTIDGWGEMTELPSYTSQEYIQKIKKAVISDGVTTIGYAAFSSCEHLESVTIPNSVTSIHDMAFSCCRALKDVKIPADVTIIGHNGFRECSSLESITIPAKVESIGGMAFNYCFALKSITFAGDAPTLGDGVFGNVTATAYYPANNETWTGVINNGYGGKLTWEASHAMHARGVFPGYDATCTQEGRTDGVLCLTCHELIVKGEVIPAKGHEGVWMDNAEEATCSKTGVKEGAICSVCGYVLIKEKTLPIDPDNHKNIVTDKAVAATCTKTGLTEGSHCSICGKVITAQTTVPVKEHTVVTDAAVAATCTKTGLTEGSHCSICGKVIKAQTTVPVKAHTAVTDAAVAATVDKTGLTEGSHCSVCGKVIQAQEVTPKLTPTAPAAPTLSIAKADGKITISWNAVSGANKYWIYRSTDGTNFKYYDMTTKTTYTNSSVTSGTKYYYEVKAVKTVDGKDYASSYSAAKSTIPLTTPALSVSKTAGKIKLSWNAVTGATKYWIYRSTDGTNFKYYDMTTKTSYTNSSVTSGTKYYYKVKAVKNVNGTDWVSSYSAAKSTVPLTTPTLSATLSSGKIKLSWGSVTGATKYWIYRSPDGKNFKYYDTTTKTSYTNSSVTAGKTYYYKIKAVKTINSTDWTSDYSNVASKKP